MLLFFLNLKKFIKGRKEKIKIEEKKGERRKHHASSKYWSLLFLASPASAALDQFKEWKRKITWESESRHLLLCSLSGPCSSSAPFGSGGLFVGFLWSTAHLHKPVLGPARHISSHSGQGSLTLCGDRVRKMLAQEPHYSSLITTKVSDSL